MTCQDVKDMSLSELKKNDVSNMEMTEMNDCLSTFGQYDWVKNGREAIAQEIVTKLDTSESVRILHSSIKCLTYLHVISLRFSIHFSVYVN